MMDFIVKYWIEGIFAAVGSGIIYLYKRLSGRVKQEMAEQKLLREGVLAMLHDRIYQSCRFYINEGVVDVGGLKNIEYLYRSYHDLGGNGTGTELYERVKKLPIKEI